jgi:hypothetical protein
VRQVQSHDIQYSVLQASHKKKSSLIDQGANRGIAGIDTRVIEHHPHWTVDICGINNHKITSIPIVTAGAVARSQQGDVVVILHQYAYHPQLESFANDVNDKSICIPGGLQHIQTVDGYVFPLSIRGGLPYLGMRPYTDSEFDLLPHVILTSDVNWDPRVLDFAIDGNDAWYDAISDNVNHSDLLDVFGDYKGRTTDVEALGSSWKKLRLSVLNMRIVPNILTMMTPMLFFLSTTRNLLILPTQSRTMLKRPLIPMCSTST